MKKIKKIEIAVLVAMVIVSFTYPSFLSELKDTTVFRELIRLFF
jgi:hypothetical protein